MKQREMQDESAGTISLKNRLHTGVEMTAEGLQLLSKELQVHSLGNGYINSNLCFWKINLQAVERINEKGVILHAGKSIRRPWQ